MEVGNGRVVRVLQRTRFELTRSMFQPRLLERGALVYIYMTSRQHQCGHYLLHAVLQ
jgi:hypothetical protein